MRNLLYITRRDALDAGLTHEGTLFGVPAWFAGDDDGQEFAEATPKVPALHAWCRLADLFYEVMSYFTPTDRVLVSPIKVVRRIEV